MAAVAEEYSSIPESIEKALDSIDGFIKNLQSTFDDGQIPEADAVVSQYQRLRSDLKRFDQEINKLISYLREEIEPDSVEDIDQIETVSRELIESAEQFQDRCQDLSQKFVDLGFSDPAESVQDMVRALDEIPVEIENSLFENQLLLVLKTEYFPATVKDTIPELTNNLNVHEASKRQNSAFMLARLAADFPAAVGQYHRRLTSRLPEAPVNEKRNLLAALVFVSDAESTTDTVARAEALELIHADDSTVALYAALVLGTQCENAKQAELIASRVMSLLDVDAATDKEVNVTNVLYELAESHPDSVAEFVPDMAAMLDNPSAQVQENVVEFLGVLGRAEYRSEIRSIRDETDNSSLEATATTTLEEFPEDGHSETETKANDSDDSLESDSILREIEEEFDAD